MPRARSTASELLDILAATPEQLAALTEGVPAARVQAPPAPDAWSVSYIVAHLRACADVFGGCISRILAEDQPYIQWVGPRTYIDRTNYPSLDLASSLDAFAAQRAELLAVLTALPPEGWQRTAIISDRQQPQSVHRFVERMALHEREHVEQIAGILAALTSPDRQVKGVAE